MSKPQRRATTTTNMSSGYEKWGTKWADYALVVDTGEKLKCHKLQLAQSSPFFEAMLSSECEEKKNGKMNVKDFNLETVTTFLEYVYVGQFNKSFDKTKITPELMRFSHMYDVQCLYDMTTNHLKENISDTNAVKLWFEAEKIKNEELKNSAVEFIVDQKEKIANWADVEAAYECPGLIKSIFAFMAKDDEIKFKFTIHDSPNEYEVCIKTNETIRTVKEVAYRKVAKSKSGFSEAQIKIHVPKYKMFTKGMEMLDDNRTLKSYGIRNGSDKFILKYYKPQ